MPIGTYSPNLKMSLREWLLMQKQKVMYLTPDPWLKGHLKDIIDMPIDEAFQRQVEELVTAYAEKGEMPAAEIQTAVFNLADDAMAGRDMVIRTGDYIALRNYMRGRKGM